MFTKILFSYYKAKISIVKVKAIVLICFFCCGFKGILLAQQNHFMYLQTESKQPFYVKLNKKVFSSSASGYVIIPKLSGGTHSFQIGFPKNDSPEQTFNYGISNDVGFIIKNFGEKGWGLFNLQSMDIVMAGLEPKKQAVKNDQIANTNDKEIINKENTNPSASQPQAVQAVNSQTVKKISQTQDATGINIVFADVTNEYIDTVQLFIPVQEEPVQNNEPVVSKEQVAQQQQDTLQSDNKFLNIELPRQDTASANVKTDTAVTETNETVNNTIPGNSAATNVELVDERKVNINCKDLAKEQDFLKLRKKMAAENNDDDMISIARKNFKNKCYTTEQIKNLGLLFLTDQGRYNFYDAAYPSVFDLRNFSTLQSQLSDEYLINRFKAMIHN